MNRRTWAEISGITLIRTVLNTGFRMIFPFQPIFMDSLGVPLIQMTRMLAGQSLLGIFSPLFASLGDTRGRKTGMIVGLILFSTGAGLMLFWPTVFGFLAFLLLSILGKSIFDPAIQAYFGDRIPYRRRGFVLAITETSWSGAFFLGVPLVGLLLNRFGLQAPFVVLTCLGAAALLTIILLIPRDPALKHGQPTMLSNFGAVFRSPSARAGLSVTALICVANQVVNVVFGVWLDQSFAFQITALGGASAVIGLAELIGEGGVSLVSDRLSKKRAALVGILGSVLSSALLPVLGKTSTGAFFGLFFFYLTFEFTIVSVIPLMTGVLPEARATTMAMNAAGASLGRGLGAWIAAPLYAAGFGLVAGAAAAINILALIALRFVSPRESESDIEN